MRAAHGVAHAGAEDLTDYPVKLRELISAGEPLNPEVIEQVRAAWGITIRDGYGQTETTALARQFARPEGEARVDGPASAGLPRGVLDAEGNEPTTARSPSSCDPRPAGLMLGYAAMMR